MTPVDGVKMWRWMIGPKHPNNDAVKAAELRHVAVHGGDLGITPREIYRSA